MPPHNPEILSPESSRGLWVKPRGFWEQDLWVSAGQQSQGRSRRQALPQVLGHHLERQKIQHHVTHVS